MAERSKKKEEGSASERKRPTETIMLSPDDNAEEFYAMFKDNVLDVPGLGNVMDGFLRNTIRMTSESWTRRFGALPCLLGKNHLWLQLLLVDERRLAQIKLYALGSRVALASDDTNIVSRSRDMFKEAAPFLLRDTGLWIFSRSLVRKELDGVIDDAAKFPFFDPLGGLDELPQDVPSGIRCTEVFLFVAGDYDVKGNHALCSREGVIELLQGLDSKEGIRKIHAFSVVAASAMVSREKLDELKAQHLTA